MRAEKQGDIQEVTFRAACKDIDRIFHFQGIADMRAQRLLHSGDNGCHRLACQCADIHHGPGQFNRAIQRMHDGSAAGLDIQDNRITAGRQFFGHDRAGNQRKAVHGGCHIPERIQRLVRRCQHAGLPDHGHADALDLLQEGFTGERNRHPGNRLQLIKCTAGMSQSASAHLCHGNAAGRYKRGEDQRCCIADAACGVLIHLNARNAAQVHGVPAVLHRQRQGGCLPRRHAVEPDGHEQGGQLIIRDRTVRRSVHKQFNLFLCQFLPELFVSDHINHIHRDSASL